MKKIIFFLFLMIIVITGCNQQTQQQSEQINDSNTTSLEKQSDESNNQVNEPTDQPENITEDIIFDPSICDQANIRNQYATHRLCVVKESAKAGEKNCYKIDNLNDTEHCLAWALSAKNDVEGCRTKINGPFKNTCLQYIAVNLKDYSYCDETGSDFCYDEVDKLFMKDAVNNKDIGICKSMRIGQNSQDCLLDVAKETNNPEICKMITLQPNKYQCEQSIDTSKPTLNYQDEITRQITDEYINNFKLEFSFLNNEDNIIEIPESKRYGRAMWIAVIRMNSNIRENVTCDAQEYLDNTLTWEGQDTNAADSFITIEDNQNYSKLRYEYDCYITDKYLGHYTLEADLVYVENFN